MDLTTLALGGGAGLFIGVIVSSVFGGRQRRDLEEKLARTRAEVRRIREETKGQLGALERRQGELDSTLETAKESSTRYKEQVAKLTASLQEVENARERATEQAAAERSSREQADGRARVSQDQAQEALKQVVALERHVATLEAEGAANKRLVDEQRDEVARLNLKLEYHEAARDAPEVTDRFADDDGSTDAVLKVLLDSERQSAAVVADSSGIVIKAVGPPEIAEGVAAAAQLVARVGEQLHGMLPIENLSHFVLGDHRHVLSGRLFTIGDDRVAMATFGAFAPDTRVVDVATDKVSKALT
ncbi:MAG: hypothetical protein H6707_14375 [Deltaproteobacteria bacterium]|nr:hypothetical protein [Deltaproteobacteria bacterium]